MNKDKLIINRIVEIDTLTGRSLSDIISYLENLKKEYGENVILTEEWYSYEDFEYAISYDKEESDIEYNTRIQKDLDEQLKKAENKEKEKRISNIEHQILDLKRELISIEYEEDTQKTSESI